MKIGVAADHAGFDWKTRMVCALVESGHDPLDFGPRDHDPQDNYPDFVIPMAEAVARGDVERGICTCGTGVGASIAANKVRGARAAPITDVVSAKAGVEDVHMNVLCLGARSLDFDVGWAIVAAFLDARFADKPRHRHLLELLATLERQEN